MIGLKFNDSLITNELERWPFEVVPDQHSRPMISLGKIKGVETKLYPE